MIPLNEQNLITKICTTVYGDLSEYCCIYLITYRSISYLIAVSDSFSLGMLCVEVYQGDVDEWYTLDYIESPAVTLEDQYIEKAYSYIDNLCMHSSNTKKKVEHIKELKGEYLGD